MKSVIIQKIKADLKELAKLIRTTRPEYRSTQSAFDKTKVRKENKYGSIYYEGDDKLGSKAYNLFNDLVKTKYQFRHKHIAYCLLRGKTLEQIERSSVTRCKDHCYCCNKPDMVYVNKLLDQMKKELHEEKTEEEGQNAQTEKIVCNS